MFTIGMMWLREIYSPALWAGRPNYTLRGVAVAFHSDPRRVGYIFYSDPRRVGYLWLST